MITKQDFIPVIFRKFSDGEVIAIFPCDLGTDSPYTCNSYLYIGQHGSCDPQGLIRITEPCTPDEYKDLYEELLSYGDGNCYNDMKVYKRYQYWMTEQRQKELTELKGL